jgi:hypothetical protein
VVTTFEIDFQWPIYNKGYEVRPAEPPSNKGFIKIGKPERIVHLGGKVRYERPLLVPTVHLQFAALDHTPDACKRFANTYGYLFQDEQSVAEGEPLKEWYREIAVLKNAVMLYEKWELLTAWGAMGDMRFTSIDVVLHPDYEDTPRLHLQPPSLISALHLQFAQTITSGAAVATCQHCAMWFEIGGTHGPKRSAITCSRRGHIALNNARRVKRKTKQ